MNRRPVRTTRPGFTMVELLVAMAVTLAIILFVNEVFSSVQRGVSIGSGVSEMLENARAIGDQIDRDAEAMIPPASNGVLVIVNRRKNDTLITEEDSINAAARLDQLMFIRNSAGIEPMMPTQHDTYSAATDERQGVVKVVYGHALHTNPDGTVNATDFGVANTPDRYAVDWVLARHQLFFDPEPNGGNADGGWYNAPTTAMGTSSAALRFIYMSVTDIAEFGFETEDPSYGAMVGGIENTGAPQAARRLWVTAQGGGSFAANTYRDRAYAYLFLNERLRVNPAPVLDPSTGYEGWKIAQMVPVLSEHVVSFEVAFAGDYSPADGLVDVDATSNAIKWYDIENPPAGGFNGGGQGPIYDNSAVPGGGTGSDKAGFIFRHGSGETRWPALIRIRYRITDPQGRIAGSDGRAGRIFEQIIRVPE